MSRPLYATGPNPQTPPECSLDCGCRWDEPCPWCVNGRVRITVKRRGQRVALWVKCDTCHGTGRVPGECDAP